MRRTALLVAATMVTGGILIGPPATAQEPGWTLTPAGWASGSVQHVGTVAREMGTAVDAVLHEDHLYVTSWRSFSIYDVSDPATPRFLSTQLLGPSLYNEQPQTNGEILLISRDARYLPGLPGVPTGSTGGVLEIYDVRDKESPQRVGLYATPAGQRDHLWTCVLDCDFAYSASGTILDLRTPSSPQRVGNWSTAAPYRPQRFHHIREVAPGIVMTGSLPVYVLDARLDPANPKPLASVEPQTTVPAGGLLMPESLPARVDWPGALKGRVALISMETPFSGPCTDQSGDFQTFTTTGWRDSGTFVAADRYALRENGTYTDGRPPANALGCSSYGLDAHPGFGKRGGAVALTFFEHGMRVLDVDGQGRINEVGGFLPHAGNSARPLWVTDELVYVIDLHRGIDILRVDDGT